MAYTIQRRWAIYIFWKKGNSLPFYIVIIIQFFNNNIRSAFFMLYNSHICHRPILFFFLFFFFFKFWRECFIFYFLLFRRNRHFCLFFRVYRLYWIWCAVKKDQYISSFFLVLFDIENIDVFLYSIMNACSGKILKSSHDVT